LNWVTEKSIEKTLEVTGVELTGEEEENSNYCTI
jgi:hypothetical protein